MSVQKVVVIDMGGDYTQLLARIIREKKVYSEILPCATSLREIKDRNPQGILITGGPSEVDREIISLLDKGIFSLGLPVMLIGYGVESYEDYQGLHYFPGYDRDKEKTLISSDGNIVATFNYPGKDDEGELLDYFLFEVAGLKAEWTPASFVNQAIAEIKDNFPENDRAVCGLSGGIDSAVAALLAHQAIGERLTCIFVDHGLMREGEPEEVVNTFRDKYNLNVVSVDASDEFLKRLEGVEEPEDKRRIIGEHFIKVFEREALKLKGVKFLVQGTIYPDIVESLSPSGETIKSHHNVGGLPERMSLKLIEPVRELFKDEVRKVAEYMNLPKEMVWRQPFPGPGLGVRVLGEITPEKVNIVRKANAIVEEEISRAGMEHDLWQFFAVLPQIRSVGVSGDRRTYAYPIILRAVTSRDAMSAEWYPFPYEILDRLSHRLIEEISQVNRVVYDITSKPPATIEWE